MTTNVFSDLIYKKNYTVQYPTLCFMHSRSVRPPNKTLSTESILACTFDNAHTGKGRVTGQVTIGITSGVKGGVRVRVKGRVTGVCPPSGAWGIRILLSNAPMTFAWVAATQLSIYSSVATGCRQKSQQCRVIGWDGMHFSHALWCSA